MLPCCSFRFWACLSSCSLWNRTILWQLWAMCILWDFRRFSGSIEWKHKKLHSLRMPGSRRAAARSVRRKQRAPLKKQRRAAPAFIGHKQSEQSHHWVSVCVSALAVQHCAPLCSTMPLHQHRQPRNPTHAKAMKNHEESWKKAKDQQTWLHWFATGCNNGTICD